MLSRQCGTIAVVAIAIAELTSQSLTAIAFFDSHGQLKQLCLGTSAVIFSPASGGQLAVKLFFANNSNATFTLQNRCPSIDQQEAWGYLESRFTLAGAC